MDMTVAWYVRSAQVFMDDMDAVDVAADPALCNAAAAGDTAQLAMCLWKPETGLRIDAPHKFGCGALWLAAANGHRDCVRLLVEGGANIEATAANGVTPFAIACQRGHLAAARVLSDAGALKETFSNNGTSPMLAACIAGREDVVRFLGRVGVGVNSAGIGTSLGQHKAESAPGQKKQLEAWRTILPMHAAACRGHADVVRRLVQLGADASAATATGMTPLHLAAVGGHADVVRVLTGAEGAPSIDARDHSQATALYLASSHGKLGVAKLLVKLGADCRLNAKGGSSPLHAACAGGYTKCARMLIERGGAGKECLLDGGLTPLHVAALGGHTSTVAALLGLGADASARPPVCPRARERERERETQA